jgi:AsmA protein
MKRIAGVAGIVVVLMLILLVALPFLVDANSFRPKLESELTNALGRDVKIGDLKFSLLTGGVAADDLSIADDPAFSNAPFVSAKSLKIAVDLAPLIFSRKINVTGITIDQPEIVLLRNASGDWNYSRLGAKSARADKAVSPAPSGNSQLDLSVNLVKITSGRVSLGKTNGRGQPLLLDKLDAELKDFAPASEMPFSLSTNVAGGAIQIDGKAGPIHSEDVTLTPVQIRLKITHLDLAASGVVDSASGMAGLVSIDGTGNSDGKNLNISGRVQAEKLKLVKGGSPATRPAEFDFALTHDLKARSGTLTQGQLHIGSAEADLAGTYTTKGDSTILNATLSGSKMPLSELESMLPALNIVLPTGTKLEAGTAAVKVSVEGPTNHLVATGSLGVNNAQLQGFNLGSKMSVLEKLAGMKGGPNTEIQTLSSNFKASQEGGATLADIKMVASGIGEISGNGTVSPSNELDFRMSASVHGMGSVATLGQNAIPFLVKGTASSPVFEPDIKGLASQQIKGVKSDAVKAATGILGGFLGKKNP